jgi:hypothetical protein
MFTQFFSFSLREVEDLVAPSSEFNHFAINSPHTLALSVSGTILPRITQADTVLVVLSKELSLPCNGAAPFLGKNVTVYLNNEKEWNLDKIIEEKERTIDVIPAEGNR